MGKNSACVDGRVVVNLYESSVLHAAASVRPSGAPLNAGDVLRLRFVRSLGRFLTWLRREYEVWIWMWLWLWMWMWLQTAVMFIQPHSVLLWFSSLNVLQVGEKRRWTKLPQAETTDRTIDGRNVVCCTCNHSHTSMCINASVVQGKQIYRAIYVCM